MFSYKTKKGESTGTIQAKLKIGQPGDKFEKEADRVADRVMSVTHSETAQMQPIEEEEEMMQPKLRMQPMEEEDEQIQMKCRECENIGLLQPKSDKSGQFASPSISEQIQMSQGNGNTLPSDTNQLMSSAFGHDFSGVHIHTDSKAMQMNQKLGARAFTVGSDIYFNEGQYDPNSGDGKHLLAHELTHTLQQSSDAQIQRQIHTEDFEDEPHVVTGHVPESRRRELEEQRLERQRTAIGSWAGNMARRQENISDMVVSFRQSLRQMEGYKNTLVEGYGVARNLVDQKIAEANASRSSRAAILDFVLGLLPGLKSAAISLRATDFISDMSILNSALEGVQSGALSGAYSRATAPVSGIRDQLLGTQELPDLAAETIDHFALRLSETLRDFTLSILDLSMVANHLGRHSLYTQVDQIQQKVGSGATLSPAEQQLAQATQNAENNWPNFNRAMLRLLSAMNRAESRLFLTAESWPLGNRFEKMLWIVYLSTLSEDQSEVIDEDEIEDRLAELRIIGNPSILGLDFGSVTWLRDTIMAVRRAQNFRPQILSALNTFNLETASYVLTPRAAEIV